MRIAIGKYVFLHAPELETGARASSGSSQAGAAALRAKHPIPAADRGTQALWRELARASAGKLWQQLHLGRPSGLQQGVLAAESRKDSVLQASVQQGGAPGAGSVVVCELVVGRVREGDPLVVQLDLHAGHGHPAPAGSQVRGSVLGTCQGDSQPCVPAVEQYCEQCRVRDADSAAAARLEGSKQTKQGSSQGVGDDHGEPVVGGHHHGVLQAAVAHVAGHCKPLPLPAAVAVDCHVQAACAGGAGSECKGGCKWAAGWQLHCGASPCAHSGQRLVTMAYCHWLVGTGTVPRPVPVPLKSTQVPAGSQL